jgi:hypothetical protein
MMRRLLLIHLRYVLVDTVEHSAEEIKVFLTKTTALLINEIHDERVIQINALERGLRRRLMLNLLRAINSIIIVIVAHLPEITIVILGGGLIHIAGSAIS